MSMHRKYQPLVDFLLASPGDEFMLSFEEMEAMVGPMDHGTRSWSYWSNGDGPLARPSRWIQKKSGFNTYYRAPLQKILFKRRNT